jgi:hypothetical protein
VRARSHVVLQLRTCPTFHASLWTCRVSGTAHRARQAGASALIWTMRGEAS